MHTVILCSSARFFQRRQHAVHALQQKIAGAGELYRQAGIQYVRAGQALMDKTRLLADQFRQMRQEGDDVVLYLALDGVDARDVKLHVLGFPHRLRGRGGDNAQLGQLVGGVCLDLEPDAIAALRAPDRVHFGPGIAGDHQRASLRLVWDARSVAPSPGKVKGRGWPRRL